jgi:hypothetical protein
LHHEYRQLWHLFQRIENCLKAINSVGVAAAIGLWCSAIEDYFLQLLDFTQFFDAFITEVALF